MFTKVNQLILHSGVEVCHNIEDINLMPPWIPEYILILYTVKFLVEWNIWNLDSRAFYKINKISLKFGT